MTEADAETKSEEEASELVNSLMSKLDVDEDVAMILVQEGFASVDEIAYVPMKELSSIEEFDEEMVNELRDRARNILITEAIEGDVAEDLSLNSMKTLTPEHLDVLTNENINDRDDLAEYASDELEELLKVSSELAEEIIMEARAHWFKE
jgi:N utilization substance protein A